MSFLSAKDKTALLIDASNLAYSMRELGKTWVDFAKLLKWASTRGNIVTARYYTAVVTEPDGTQPLRDRLTWLQCNGYQVVEKPAIVQGETIKGNMDIEMVCDMFKLKKHVDKFILFTGDGDFTCVVRMLQDKGKKVEVVSTEGMCSVVFRRQANSFVDLRKLIGQLNELPQQTR